jgi:hypothetical protein
MSYDRKSDLTPGSGSGKAYKYQAKPDEFEVKTYSVSNKKDL